VKVFANIWLLVATLMLGCARTDSPATNSGDQRPPLDPQLKSEIDKAAKEGIAAAEEATTVFSQIKDGPTAKAKRAEFVASIRRLRRSTDAFRSLARKMTNAPPLPAEEQKTFQESMQKVTDAQMRMMTELQRLTETYPTELVGAVSEALQDEPRDK
jgi:hypothetical protein